MTEAPIPVCQCGCGRPLPTRKHRGRRAVYATRGCRDRAYRMRLATAAVLHEMNLTPADRLPSPVPPRAVYTDEQVARALLEARGVAGTFLRLGRDARPQLAWRSERLGTAIVAAIDDYFSGAFE